MADSPRMFFDVYQLLAETGVTDVLHAYFGERPAFGYQKGVLRRTEGKNNWGWHQDGAILGQEIASLNVWLALSDCGESSPSLDIVPRRIDHLVETGTDGANRSWSIAPDQIPEAAGATPVVRPVFAPGDALLFDHLLLHRAGGDVTMRLPRYAIESWFFAPSNYPATQLPLLV